MTSCDLCKKSHQDFVFTVSYVTCIVNLYNIVTYLHGSQVILFLTRNYMDKFLAFVYKYNPLIIFSTLHSYSVSTSGSICTEAPRNTLYYTLHVSDTKKK
jgi:hypothetical protein